MERELEPPRGKRSRFAPAGFGQKVQRQRLRLTRSAIDSITRSVAANRAGPGPLPGQTMPG